MAYVITAACVADYSCLEVCPVKCISPGPDDSNFADEEQLYIDPATCIDCAACIEICPVLAIYEESQLPAKLQHYTEVNKQYFAAHKAASIGEAP